MFIPNYFDEVSIVVIDNNGNSVDTIPVCVADELLLHTLQHIEEYITNMFESSCNLKAMEMRKAISDGEEITIADFLIQLD